MSTALKRGLGQDFVLSTPTSKKAAVAAFWTKSELKDDEKN
jgi:hypothetical protein